MGTQKLSRTLIGVAGVHHVVSELSRRNLIALPTTRETAGYDVIVATVDGKRHANVQVKASLRQRSRFWPVAGRFKDIRTGPEDHYLFLEGIKEGCEIKTYALKGTEVKKEIKSHYGTINDDRPFAYCLYIDDVKRKKWADNWERWKP